MQNLVAIVGRPNVGKSTLFNRLCGKKLSIVEDVPGVTRDRIYSTAEWSGTNFSIVDTGGIDFTDTSDMGKHIVEQAQIAIDLADVVLFIVDGQEGLTKADHDGVSILRKTKKPVFIVVNKLDNDRLEMNAYDFYNLGFSNVSFISAVHGRGVGDLLDEVIACFSSKGSEKRDDEAPLKLALVGKPNAGKSSIINRLLGENRLVVSSVAGTTRDSVDAEVTYNGKKYILVDTAGIRKKSAVEDKSIELYSVLRSFEAIRQADVVLFVVDATENVTDQDLKLMSFIDREGKPSVIVMNKWDAVPKDTYTINSFTDKIKHELDFISYVKPIFVSALSGKRLTEIFDTALEVYENSSRRISTGTLNELLHEAFRLVQPPTIKGTRLKLFYGTQAETNPPTFVLFVNNALLEKTSYTKYIENFLRKSVNFEGTPVRINFKSRIED